LKLKCLKIKLTWESDVWGYLNGIKTLIESGEKMANVKLKCGFCNKEIRDRKELETTKFGRKTIISCPYCNAILGFYYA